MNKTCMFWNQSTLPGLRVLGRGDVLRDRRRIAYSGRPAPIETAPVSGEMESFSRLSNFR